MGQLQAKNASSPDAIPPPPQFMPFPSTPSTPKEDEKISETAKSRSTNDNPGDLETLTRRSKGNKQVTLKLSTLYNL